MIEESLRLRNRVLLTLHQELVGEIPESTFGVTFALNGRHIDLVFYLYAQPTPDVVDDIGAIAAEALAQLADEITDVEAYLVPLASNEPMKLDEWLFLSADNETRKRIPLYSTEKLDVRSRFAQFAEATWLRRFETE